MQVSPTLEVSWGLATGCCAGVAGSAFVGSAVLTSSFKSFFSSSFFSSSLPGAGGLGRLLLGLGIPGVHDIQGQEPGQGSEQQQVAEREASHWIIPPEQWKWSYPRLARGKSRWFSASEYTRKPVAGA